MHVDVDAVEVIEPALVLATARVVVVEGLAEDDHQGIAHNDGFAQQCVAASDSSSDAIHKDAQREEHDDGNNDELVHEVVECVRRVVFICPLACIVTDKHKHSKMKKWNET